MSRWTAAASMVWKPEVRPGAWTLLFEWIGVNRTLILGGISIYHQIQDLHFILETRACKERPLKVIVKKVATWCPKKLDVMVIRVSMSPRDETNLSLFPFPSFIIVVVFDTIAILNMMWSLQLIFIESSIWTSHWGKHFTYFTLFKHHNSPTR